jgi:hypothetical protein|tara:strand:+ start:128 stop:334 length:207 start_codon:yes stop_codon:yes gene_type:complete
VILLHVSLQDVVEGSEKSIESVTFKGENNTFVTGDHDVGGSVFTGQEGSLTEVVALLVIFDFSGLSVL